MLFYVAHFVMLLIQLMQIINLNCLQSLSHLRAINWMRGANGWSTLFMYAKAQHKTNTNQRSYSSFTVDIIFALTNPNSKGFLDISWTSLPFKLKWYEPWNHFCATSHLFPATRALCSLPTNDSYSEYTNECQGNWLFIWIRPPPIHSTPFNSHSERFNCQTANNNKKTH